MTRGFRDRIAAFGLAGVAALIDRMEAEAVPCEVRPA